MYTYYILRQACIKRRSGGSRRKFVSESFLFLLYFIALLTLGVRFISVYIFKVYQPVTTEIGGVKC